VKPSKAEQADAYELATLRDKDTCQRCRRDCGPTARDHRQNRQPGNTVVCNLQVLGLRCHIWKTEHPKDALAEGWAVPSWADPLVWPARRWETDLLGIARPVWVLYRNDGTWDRITDDDATRRMGGGPA
jgi:hypothetical protein